MALSGPMNKSALVNALDFWGFVDDFSRKMKICFLKEKTKIRYI